ncbi:MAG: HIT family protein [Candidatus Saccharimonadales bacterium]
MEPSIFTRIINGEIPCSKIYEDDKTIAFLDIHPTQPGHTLVVPKVQIDHFDDLDDTDYQAVWATVKKVSKALKKAFGRKRVGIRVIGLDVPHAHVHVFPIDSLDDYTHMPDMNAQPDFSELTIVAEKLVKEIQNV